MTIEQTNKVAAVEYAVMKATSGAKPRPGRWFAFAGLLLIAIGFLFPLVWMMSTSLKSNEKTMAFPPTFIPDDLTLYKTKEKGLVPKDTAIPIPNNYGRAITHPKFDFALFARNTLIIAILTVVGTTFSSSLVAYGFAKIRFKGRGLLFGLMLATMMIPFPVTMLGIFIVFKWLGMTTGIPLLGTFRPLWIPAFFGSAFSVFLLRQFFMTIPDELSEAARIDGCSEISIFFRIMLPLARPALAVVALFSFMHAWNDFLGPLNYIQDPKQYTLALGLQAFQSQHGGTEWNLLMAASLLVVTPVIVLFFLVQRTFIQGIATTGIKG
jgi:multiple sugar transport system permease protein